MGGGVPGLGYERPMHPEVLAPLYKVPGTKSLYNMWDRVWGPPITRKDHQRLSLTVSLFFNLRFLGQIYMAILGAHMSIAGGYHKAVEAAAKAGCDCVQIFTKNKQL